MISKRAVFVKDSRLSFLLPPDPPLHQITDKSKNYSGRDWSIFSRFWTTFCTQPQLSPQPGEPCQSLGRFHMHKHLGCNLLSLRGGVPHWSSLNQCMCWTGVLIRLLIRSRSSLWSSGWSTHRRESRLWLFWEQLWLRTSCLTARRHPALYFYRR